MRADFYIGLMWFRGEECAGGRCFAAPGAEGNVEVQEFQMVSGECLSRVTDAFRILLFG